MLPALAAAANSRPVVPVAAVAVAWVARFQGAARARVEVRDERVPPP